MRMMCQYANVSMCQCAVLLYRRFVGTLAHWHIGILAYYSIVILFLFLGSLPVAAQILQPMPIVEEKVEYDALTNRYLIRTIIGGQEMDVPIIMTPAEYLDWSMKRSMQNYYRQRNDSVFSKGKEEFDFTNMKFNLGPAEKIFGPGGVQIRTQGSAELSLGVKYNNVQNPTLPESMRKTWGFDFDEKININVNGKVGDKVNLDMNYNTDATFDFDSKKLKLKYEGKEDEIIKLLEAGNVSMTTGNSLIRGATSLFGVRADLQFGKLKLQTVISQQESESKTVNSKGGAQTIPFDFSADEYDENRHFFLAHYFRDTYDHNMAQLPNILSGVKINRVEVWVTNKRGNYENPRNIVAFTDLGESQAYISKGAPWIAISKDTLPPANGDNNLYQQMTSTYSAARNISAVNSVIGSIPGMESGMNYEKIETARLLTSSEYTVNTTLGYISLKQTLQSDEVLAVAFDYTINGKTYQVGEFSSDIKETSDCLFVKLLKNTSNSPDAACWDLMMKNVYSLNAYQVQKEKFTLNITYLSDTTGVYLRYIPEGKINKIPLLKVMNLDRLNSKNQLGGDGFFDFVEGYTVNAQNGRIFFPVVEPFGSYLETKFDNPNIAKKYVFKELYDSTLTVARQLAEKNKFRLQGEYRASSANEIRLGSMNVPRGSVRVTAGGRTLTENSDYSVDYTMGVVTILNQSIIDAGTPISVNLESNTSYNMQRKTMLGLNFTYDFSPDFQFGGTVMYLKEKPLTTKVAMGDEPISNTLWGLNASWKRESQWLTNMVDKLPFVEATAPSNINLGLEFAQLLPGHGGGLQDNSSYIDDFESAQSGIDLHQPLYWQLSSTPFKATGPDNLELFPESRLSDSIPYGKNRALLAWYHIDGLFTRRNSSLTPTHIKNDLDQLSNHYVREVYESELYPKKELNNMEASTMSILNVAYYPRERGPYNLDRDLDENGNLLEPEKRWGGMMRKIETTDFEKANIEYVEFWLLDPFIYADGDEPGADNTRRKNARSTTEGGYLYLNLGDVSEDILKDGKKFFENGLPIDGDESKVDYTNWGRVPKDRSLVYAFDNTAGARKKQDVGLNGLSVEDERAYPTYVKYLEEIRPKLNASVFEKFYESPAGDKYHYFRGSDYDAEEKSILERYKYINNTEGNSAANEDSPEGYPTAAKTSPDIEDINQDNTLSETEKYFQYRIHLTPSELKVGTNNITDKRVTKVKLRNGQTEEVTWYQFKVPVRSGTPVGSIRDFKSIRFMRMFLTGFSKPVILRFATLELVRGDWRTYTDPLYNLQNPAPTVTGTLDVSTVNIEENGDKTPINYVMPPGISRVIDPGQPQLRQQNEQAMSLKVENLAPGDARAVYKNSTMDMRQYRRLKMFTHAGALTGDVTDPKDGELSVFIRLGSDYSSNFYEYEIPLKLTPAGNYNGDSDVDKLIVWPKDNMLDIALSVFTDIKKKRNQTKNNSLSGVSYGKLYSEYDPDKPANKVSIIGNPSLAEVKTMMIGVRNNSRAKKSAEIWVNELRLSDFDEEGGWAAQGNMNVQLSDLGSISMAGHVETAGFGGLEQSVSERRLDDYYQYQFTTTFELGRFFPKAVKLSAPVYFSYSREKTSPKYNPLDQDMLLKDALDALSTNAERDSLRNIANTITTYKNFSLSNMRVGVTSKNPMPYDPGNFTMSYSRTNRHNQGSTTVYENETDWRGALSYNYAPVYKAWEPFKGLKSKSKWMKFVKELNLSYLPQNISFNTDMNRHYYELQLRDMENLSDPAEIPVSVAKDFLWNRDFSLRWDLTKNLRMNFTSATHAEIEEPYGVVNRTLDPDEYEAKKDTIRRSLLSFGRPIDYQQTFNATYKLPFDKFPVTDWMTADTRFNSSYSWDRGVSLSDGKEMGNTIANQRTFDVNGRLNLETLYNKVPFLKETNRRFATTSSTRRPNNRQKAKPKRYEKEIQLKKDTTITVRHSLGSKKPKVSALTVDGDRYPIRYKVIDANTIRIETRDSVRVKLTAIQGPKPEDNPWYKIAQSAARVAMMVRNVSITYKNTYAMTLPGFQPEIGDMLGQTRGSSGFAPGLDFAFGMTGGDYIDKAIRNNWLIQNNSNIEPATTNAQEDLQIRMTLEPLRDLKIDLNAGRTRNDSRSIQFMYDGMPEVRSGNFNMTVITIGSSFERHNPSNGYSSSSFNRFLGNLDVIQKRVEQLYQGVSLPGMEHYPQTFNSISKYNSSVMIPAFLAAYTGRDAGKSSLDIFPGILSMMPNWRITYSGLSKLEFFKKYFKIVTLTHGYRSTYSVGSYSTFQSFHSYMGDLGFVDDVQTGIPVPSSIYDVSAVSINEQFSPLFGVDVTFKNGITTKVEYKTTRILNLSLAANQVVESGTKDFVVGMGYKIMGLELFPGRNTKNSKNKISNDLALRADVSFRNQFALCRDIQQVTTQATSGNKALKISFSADYTLSRLLSVSLYYDRQKNTPLVSASSYPVTSADFGMRLKFSLTR